VDEIRDLGVDRSSISGLRVMVGRILGLRELFDVAEAGISHRLYCPPLDDHPGLHCLIVILLRSKLLVGVSD
jgi:hypothetical protein